VRERAEVVPVRRGDGLTVQGTSRRARWSNSSVLGESRGSALSPAGIGWSTGGHPRASGRLASAYATMLRKGPQSPPRGGRVRAGDDQARVKVRAQRQRDQRRGPGGPATAVAGSAARDPLTAAASRYAPRPRGPASRSTSSFWTNAAPSSPRADRRKLERRLSGRECRGIPRRDPRAQLPAHELSSPIPTSCCGASIMRGVREAGLEGGGDCAGGTRSLVCPAARHERGGRLHTLNNGWESSHRPRHRAEARRAAVAGRRVSSSRRFGVRFDPVGERIQTRPWREGRAGSGTGN